MALDGTYAFVRGDYVTPRSGQYAGALGPWATVVRAVGVDPRSTAMKAFFVAYGVAWLVVDAAFATGAPWAGWAMVVAAAGSLWYLPVGTGLGILQLGLLAWLGPGG